MGAWLSHGGVVHAYVDLGDITMHWQGKGCVTMGLLLEHG